MLVPAILYKEEIEKSFQKYFYTKDMFYETGCLEQWCPEIQDIPSEGCYQYAIVRGDEVIGYMSYCIDMYNSCVSRFGLMSFDRGSVTVGKDVFNKLEELVNRFHRVEWRMIGGNPAERSYDAFCKRHNGAKHVFKDSIKDYDGVYHDDIVYEIINDKIK